MKYATIALLGAVLMLVGCFPPSKDDDGAITGTVQAWRPNRANDMVQFCCHNSIIVGGGISGLPIQVLDGNSRQTQCLLTTQQKAEQLSCLLY